MDGKLNVTGVAKLKRKSIELLMKYFNVLRALLQKIIAEALVSLINNKIQR